MGGWKHAGTCLDGGVQLPSRSRGREQTKWLESRDPLSSAQYGERGGGTIRESRESVRPIQNKLGEEKAKSKKRRHKKRWKNKPTKRYALADNLPLPTSCLASPPPRVGDEQMETGPGEERRTPPTTTRQKPSTTKRESKKNVQGGSSFVFPTLLAPRLGCSTFYARCLFLWTGRW